MCPSSADAIFLEGNVVCERNFTCPSSWAMKSSLSTFWMKQGHNCEGKGVGVPQNPDGWWLALGDAKAVAQAPQRSSFFPLATTDKQVLSLRIFKRDLVVNTFCFRGRLLELAHLRHFETQVNSTVYDAYRQLKFNSGVETQSGRTWLYTSRSLHSFLLH